MKKLLIGKKKIKKEGGLRESKESLGRGIGKEESAGETFPPPPACFT